MWEASAPVDRDEEASAYLSFRGIDPVDVRTRDLARALPSEGRLPYWAAPWRASKHRLLVPMVDVNIELRSVLARSVERTPQRKSLAPAGFARSGLVMACPRALELLVGNSSHHGPGDARFVIAEGEIDYLAVASRFDAAHQAAALGIFSGSWTNALAARVPDGSSVLIATDPDEQGDRYADRIVDTFEGRDVALERWRPACAESGEEQ